MNLVFVPLDASEKDERALSAAVALAHLVDGDLHLVQVLAAPIDGLSDRAIAFGALDAARERRAHALEHMRDIAGQLAATTEHSVTTEVAESFDVATALLEFITLRAPELVVMATRAPGVIGRALRGSVADRVMRESPCPVVLVPPAAVLGERSVSLRRVIVPLDGSELALAAVSQLLALARGHELEYVLLEVLTSAVPPKRFADAPVLRPYGGLPDVEHESANAEWRLNTVADRLRAAGVKKVRVRIEEDIDPSAAIARAVREEGADFLAMSTRGRSGLKRFLLGSVAEEVVGVSTVPVMLIVPSSSGSGKPGSD